LEAAGLQWKLRSDHTWPKPKHFPLDTGTFQLLANYSKAKTQKKKKESKKIEKEKYLDQQLLAGITKKKIVNSRCRWFVYCLLKQFKSNLSHAREARERGSRMGIH